jgi:hypothetical protein
MAHGIFVPVTQSPFTAAKNLTSCEVPANATGSPDRTAESREASG